MAWWIFLLVFLGAYLIGSCSWALFLVRLLRGEDLRKHGSGNLGATNAARLLGTPWFFAIYILDALKGFVPTWLAAHYLDGTPPPGLVAGLGAILGHVFPFYLRFRGGKGVATASGVIVALYWPAALVALAVWLVSALLTRFVSLSSILAAVALPVAYAFMVPAELTDKPMVLGFLIVIAVLVVVLHRSNLRRIFRGEERRIGGKKS